MAGAKRVIDLDQARAARAEAEKQPVTLKVAGQRLELPAELPAEYALYIDEGHVRAGVEALLGEHADAFWELKPSADDVGELITQVDAVYGIDQGK